MCIIESPSEMCALHRNNKNRMISVCIALSLVSVFYIAKQENLTRIDCE